MAKRRLTDPTQTHAYVACPACGQKYAVFSVMLQDDEEMACTECNALFRLSIDDKDKVQAHLVTPATGSPKGPAEGPQRR